MMTTSLLIKRVLAGATMVSALALGGCLEGTELNGKVFDLLGVSSQAQAAAKTEPKMAPRAGLVLPPDASRLPEPGSGGAEAQPTALADLDDPDKKRVMAAAERERLHKAYCRGDMSWKEQLKDPDSLPKSPYGPCGVLGGALQ